MPSLEEIIARRARLRTRRRRRRVVAVAAALAVVVAAGVWGVLAVKRLGERRPAASPSVAAALNSSASPQPTRRPVAKNSARPNRTPSPTARSTRSPSAAPSRSASPKAVASSSTAAAPRSAGGAPRPPIVQDFITFGAQRRAEMAAYSLAHYGSSDIRLHAKVIVVHYTAGSTYANAHATFESDAANMGVKPGVVSHFVIAKDGTIYQQLPLSYEGRHTVGLNHVAFGIECVQEGRGSDAQTVSAIMHRPAQLRALVALTRWLMGRYHISLANVIGHGMANASPYFRDLKGWKNDHTDWQRPQIELLRAKLR